MKRILLTLTVLFFIHFAAYSFKTGTGEKDTVFTTDKGRWLTSGGYASWLHMAMFEKPSGSWINNSMLHNRLNFKAYAGSSLAFNFELRNRFVTGDMVRIDPSYGAGLSDDDGSIDLSWNIFSGNSYLLNTMIDRAFVNFSAGRLQISAGRQRINWSQALIWNPNDIFNTYSLFDFDYIERPGSDALRLVYSSGPASAAEAVVKVGSDNRLTAAALFRFSMLNTDLQFFAGETGEEFFTAGTGWSGAIGSMSLRGEAALFAPFRGSDEERSTFLATVGVDRVFSDRVTTMVQVMYSSNPIDPGSFTELYEGSLSARQLAFSEFSTAGQFTYSPLPLLNLSLSGIWFPGLNGFYAGPSVDWSMAENVDFTFLWQHFTSDIAEERIKINLGFLRFRYNF